MAFTPQWFEGPLATTNSASGAPFEEAEGITVCLCGDVMTGRGIDQVLPHPSDARIYESYMKSALGYVELAERANGRIPKPVDFSYVWGDALQHLNGTPPDARIINLETAVTTSNDYWKGKGINYRMHPSNTSCLTAATIDCCALANNHVLDWGYSGLAETLSALKKSKLKIAGAGKDLEDAAAPAVIPVAGKGRVLVFSLGSVTSGIPSEWAASKDRPGVNLLEDLSPREVEQIHDRIRAVKCKHDIVVVSLHWGSNWGYRIPRAQTKFAHRLIDHAAVDIVHGHSSHHPRAIEVYKEKPIIYGCGDFLNDYEGIGGYEVFRGDLVLMYLATMTPGAAKLERFRIIPFQIKRFRLQRASAKDARWLKELLNRELRSFETHVELNEDHSLVLRWA
jgi:poly-gamma-glutamate synthesis protein (capsule biosynthesis protein)